MKPSSQTVKDWLRLLGLSALAGFLIRWLADLIQF